MRYIPDKEINLLEEEDLLGTMSYVNTLSDVVEECETPFTIGLFGGWGTGKSSIVNTYQKKIESEGTNETLVIKYDAWKYSHDSFRRTFILELTDKLKLKTKRDFNKVFYKDEVQEKDLKPNLKEYWYLYLIPIAFILIFITAFWFTNAEKDIKTLITVFGFLTAALTFFLSNAIVVNKTTIIHSKIFSPEQFEKIFSEIIEEVTLDKRSSKEWIIQNKRQKKYNKIVIIVDNLDRCQKETAIKLMLNIKNFLEKENCIFVLPVDDLAIKRFLQMDEEKQKSHTNRIDGDEFLRKFFNSAIKIKNLTDFELYDYALELKRKYNLDISNDTLSIIAQEFSRNPRRIIQFLNNLLTEWKVLKNAKELGHLHSEEVLNNVEFLAKILIIKEEWPDLYDQIIIDNRLLRRIDEKISTINLSKEQSFPLEINKDVKLPKEQYFFFLKTKAFSTENIEPFIKTKDVLKDLPDDLERLILDQNWSEIRVMLGKELNFGSLIDFVLYLFNRDVLKRNLIRQNGYNIISLVMKIGLDDNFQNEFNVYYRRLSSIFDTQYLGQIIEIINPNLLIQFSRNILIRGDRNVLDLVLDYVKNGSENKQREDLLVEIILEYSTNQEILSQIKQEFTELVIQNEEILRTLEELPKDTEIINPLVTNELLDHFINTLVIDPNQNLTKQKISYIKVLLYREDENSLITQFINKTIGFPQTPKFDFMKFWFNTYDSFLMEENQSIYSPIYNMVNNRHSFFIQRINNNQIQNNEEQEEVLISLIKLIKKLYIFFQQNRQPLSNFLLAYYREDLDKSLKYIDTFFREVFSKNLTTEWLFAPGLFNKFKGFKTVKSKTLVADTILMMLENPRSLEILQESLVSTIIDCFFNLLISGGPHYIELSENSISRLMKINHLIDIVGRKIEQYLGQEPTRIIKILVNFPEDEIKKRIAVSLFANIVDYTKLLDISNKLLNLSDDGIQLLKYTLIETLKLISIEDKDHYITVLEICTENIEIFNQPDK
ncbi:MAG: hypothetical protein KAU62_05395, partial [Candidatus Heimdallarchaeota archaeon]|nr:hypothetical protein [Candidatus Heimdallarchaeota archaeon]MCK4610575.1 hypothetical protein [Candidatus Heimdallarchaeota archaeon]